MAISTITRPRRMSTEAIRAAGDETTRPADGEVVAVIGDTMHPDGGGDQLEVRERRLR
jgi:hypothetical protein